MSKERRLILINIFLIIVTIASLSYAVVEKQIAKEQEERAKAAEDVANINAHEARKLAQKFQEYVKEVDLRQSKAGSVK